jgi:hypothetical protein
MKVRYASRPGITGDSSSFNMHGLGEVIIHFPEGDATSEEIRELDVWLEARQRWVPLGEALKRNDVITDNRVSHFREPRDQAERDRGWSD